MDPVEELRKAIVAKDLDRAATLIGSVWMERDGLRRALAEPPSREPVTSNPAGSPNVEPHTPSIGPSLDTIVRITKEAAADALRGAAFTNEEDGRTTVHSFLSFLGADHDLDRALEMVERSEDRGWVTDVFRHDLSVLVDGKVYRYDVPRPDREAKP